MSARTTYRGYTVGTMSWGRDPQDDPGHPTDESDAPYTEYAPVPCLWHRGEFEPCRACTAASDEEPTR